MLAFAPLNLVVIALGKLRLRGLRICPDGCPKERLRLRSAVQFVQCNTLVIVRQLLTKFPCLLELGLRFLMLTLLGVYPPQIIRVCPTFYTPGSSVS